MQEGMIERICDMGLERQELCDKLARAHVGGMMIPYSPRDLAAILTQLRNKPPTSYLALESTTQGGIKFLQEMLDIPEVYQPAGDEKKVRSALRSMKQPVDLISIDLRGYPLDAETVWKYILGGKEEPAKEFGKGAPTDYGICKLKVGGFILLNRADKGAFEMWFRLRDRYTRMYQSALVGMVNVREGL